MQKLWIFLLGCMICNISAKAQPIRNIHETIFLFPGQGSDSALFQNLRFKRNYQVRNIHYPIPPKNCSMQQFAQMLVSQIDTSEPYIFIGVSMGGMLAVELSEIMHPKQVILVSSAKNRAELPFRYRFQKHIPLYKIFPASIIKLGARCLQPIVEPDRRKFKKEFKRMLLSKDKTYLKRSIQMIVNWERKSNAVQLDHIHGTRDHTIPIRNVKDAVAVKKGSHMMMLTRASDLTELIDQLLNKKLEKK
jgi:pimeloyl-ACP methyl ester carboxylesterase